MKFVKNLLLSLFFISLFILATGAAWFYSKVEDALPQLDGKQTLYGLSATTFVERDGQGIPTITATNRNDIALATGYLHSQERFFQMDLLRRNAAGELSSLFGDKALDYDKTIRRHRFRDRARTIINNLPKEQKSLLEAYTRGVNQGLKYLKSAPFEYLLLRQEPVEWQEEDSILAVFSMYIDLQYHDGKRERTLGLLKDTVNPDYFQFLNPRGSQWDAAIDDSVYPPSAMPSEFMINTVLNTHSKQTFAQIEFDEQRHDLFPGSNNWAVSGAHSSSQSGMVANDMHLNLRIPNTWYRASFHFTENEQATTVTGVTLPGVPIMVIGSNSKIAWGFTNSYGDWNDVVIIETNTAGDQYLTPDGYQPFSYYNEIIAIKDQQAQEVTIQGTIWGPVIGKNHRGELLAYRWVAHDLNAVNMNMLQLEQAQTVAQAMDIAAISGIPAQNMMIADHQGDIGWTIMGAIPKRSAIFGETPESWANGQYRWTGYLKPNEYPKVRGEKLWTANSRVVGGEMLSKLGNGGYALGARAQQIKNGLEAQQQFTEQDLLAIALDDRALFLTRWRDFILEQVISEQQLSHNARLHDVKDILLKDTALSASVDSVAYRIVRNFRINLRDRVFDPLIKQLVALDPHFNFRSIRHQIETPLWQLINQQPTNFLPSNQSWQQLFAGAMAATLADMTKEQLLSEATWGQQNTINIQHPLARAIPLLSHWLDMPNSPQAGDSYMPRVQGKSFGASQRMVVSPGHEANGIFHMPGSQSGHPWSPYYRSGHDDWAQGKASPFLPGETVYRLTLLSY